MKQHLKEIFIAAAVTVMFAGNYSVLACPAISLIVSTTTVAPQDIVEVGIGISGLGDHAPPSVGAFDFDLVFDETLLQPQNVTFYDYLGDPDPLAGEALAEYNFMQGIVDIAEVSLLPSVDLDFLQPPSFWFATVSFVAVDFGSVSLYLSQIRVDDAFGDKIPEPDVLFLLGAGAFSLWTSIKRRQQRLPWVSRR